MRDKQSRVVIFAGAGASKAVSAEKFPTTVEFFDGLPSHIREDVLFQFSLNYLRSAEKRDVIDIEMVLWSLQTLSGFYGSIQKPKDIIGHSFANNLIGRLFTNQNYGHLPGRSPQLKAKVDGLISNINEIVYDLYSYEPSEEELSRSWAPLLSRLLDFGARVDVFTTNYDTVVETALEIISDEQMAAHYQGIQGRRRRIIDLSRWEESSSAAGGLLTKLHGSLDWKLQGDRIHVGDALFTGDHTKHAIIYPGFKGESKLPFFATFHGYLGRMLSEADYVLFIGFAFRDEHINDIIRNSLGPDARVFLINPEKSVIFPYTRAKVKYFRDYFGMESTVKVLNAIGVSA